MTFIPKLPAEMRKLAEAAEKHWSRVDIMLGGNPIGTDEVSPFVAACSPSQILHDADLIEAQGKRIEELTETLSEARELVEHWGGYAGEFFQNKWDLAGDLADLDALLTPEGAQP